MTSLFSKKKICNPAFHRESLYENILPFWLRHGMDSENGGMFTGLSRNGALIETDKSVWFQGRAAWTFAIAYHKRPKGNEALLQAALSCEAFSDNHCYNPKNGRMYFRVSKDGKGLIQRRYYFSECFAAIAKAALAICLQDASRLEQGHRLLLKVLEYSRTPPVEAKIDPSVRPLSGLALPMILIGVAQELRDSALSLPKISRVSKNQKAEFYTQLIAEQISIIAERHMKPELQCLLENTGPNGEYLKDHFEGRLICPGHSIEAAWFIFREADFLLQEGTKKITKKINSEAEKKAQSGKATGEKNINFDNSDKAKHYIEMARNILDWNIERGWDEHYGGLFYFRDSEGLPSSEYWQDMKFWWPQNEAVIACAYAYLLTGEETYLRGFEQVLSWALDTFADAEYGEWFGYVHRDGRLSVDLKGNMFKGPFHIPRMHLQVANILERIHARHGAGQ